jgi:hypothetical protein
MRTPVKDRFMNLLEIKDDGCWMWKGYRHHKYAPYGWFWFKGKYEYAHRMAWRLFRGEIPKGLFVCHHCDVMGCVNPDHLFLGTQDDNMKDAAKKNRPVGNRKGRRLSEDNVSEIRFGVGTYEELARRFGVNRQIIWRVKTGREYKDLPMNR